MRGHILAFLEKILPDNGEYCVATALPKGGFSHKFFKDLADAAAEISIQDKAGKTCYIAQATFDSNKIKEALKHNKLIPRDLSFNEKKKLRKVVRGQENALKLKNFFLDIDCGEKWPLKNQKDGVAALKKFIKDTKLPFPTVVNSGNGLYAHWILEEAIPADKWKTIAFILKNTVAKYSPGIGGDSSRTADSASVLRVPGTFNKKPGKEKKRVSLLKDTSPVTLENFVDLLKKAANKKGINTTTISIPKPLKDINSEFFGGLEQKYKLSDAKKIADKCSQIDNMRTVTGNIPEPIWYACLGILAYCEKGNFFAQEWSKGHPDYDKDQTISKLEQWKNRSGPTTCVNFGDINPQGCIGCKYNSLLKSPIILGQPDPEIKETPVEQCDPPAGFRRANDGIFADQDGRWLKFYDQDLYPNQLAYDESLGYEVMTIKHQLPHEGEMDCTIRSSIVNDPKTLISILSDNHIKVVGFKEKKLMAAYLESYAAKLQRNRRMSMLLCQMGWKKSRNKKDMFVLGNKVYHFDGTVDNASLAKNVPPAAKAFHSKGSLKVWADSTEIFNAFGMEPHAFAFLAGAFGAPLMKFTGFDGAMVSLVGKTGAGKTLLLRLINSVWGYHHDLMMLKDDTKNALVSRLGVYGNLPLTIDEITNISGIELSDLVYRITQGRDKARLTKSSEEKKIINRWNTLAVTSSNSPLTDKLSLAKHDASAEINRLFEYTLDEHPNFCGDITTDLYWMLDKNYGVAGEKYAKWLVQNIKTVENKLAKVKILVDRETEIQPDERFWGAILAATICGGLIAHDLGLVKFNIRPILNWAMVIINDLRVDKKGMSGDAVDILGQFLDYYASSRLVVNGCASNKALFQVIEEPKNSLIIRYEVTNGKLYLSRAAFKIWLGKRFGSYQQVAADLKKYEVLTHASKRKVLGAGTMYGGAQQVCWEIAINHPRLGKSVADLVKTSQASAIKINNKSFL